MKSPISKLPLYLITLIAVRTNGFIVPSHQNSPSSRISLIPRQQQNIITESPSSCNEVAMSRRKAFKTGSSTIINGLLASTSFSLLVPPSLADDTTPITSTLTKSTPFNASWSATSGLNTNDEKFIAFSSSAYSAMRDDPSRTPLFKSAIQKRLDASPGGPEAQVVLDLGTGPYALFAILAAEAGAGKVFAMESNPMAARVARQTVEKAGFTDVVTILEGFSTELELPGGIKADLVVAEIIGSISSEEGAYATIHDAHQRLVKNPNDPKSWIPSRIQTIASPASYSLHNLFKPPAFDWTKMDGEPVRFNCRDEGLQLLCDPVVVEDISFSDIIELENARSSDGGVKKEVTFRVDGERMELNQIELYTEFYKRGRLPKDEASKLSAETARSFSGVAFWPRLILNDAGDDGINAPLVVNSRSYPMGNHQKSHWQTVLPIMTGNTPIGDLKGGDKVVLEMEFETPTDVLKTPSYKVKGTVESVATA